MGALGSAFITTFTGYLARRDRAGAWRLASAIINWVLLVLIALGLLAGLFAPQLVRTVIAPGFADPAQQALAAARMRGLMASTVVFGVSGLLMGILNAHTHFLLPALAPVATHRRVRHATAAVPGDIELRLARRRRAAIDKVVESVGHVELDSMEGFFEVFVEGCQFKPMLEADL